MRRFTRSLLISSAFTSGCIAAGVCLWDSWRSKGVVASMTSQTSPLPSLYAPERSAPRGSVFSPYCSLPEAVEQVGLPGLEPMQILPGFICQYDRRNRIPRWTLELLTSEYLHGNANDLVDRYFFITLGIRLDMINLDPYIPALFERIHWSAVWVVISSSGYALLDFESVSSDESNAHLTTSPLAN